MGRPPASGSTGNRGVGEVGFVGRRHPARTGPLRCQWTGLVPRHAHRVHGRGGVRALCDGGRGIVGLGIAPPVRRGPRDQADRPRSAGHAPPGKGLSAFRTRLRRASDAARGELRLGGQVGPTVHRPRGTRSAADARRLSAARWRSDGGPGDPAARPPRPFPWSRCGPRDEWHDVAESACGDRARVSGSRPCVARNKPPDRRSRDAACCPGSTPSVPVTPPIKGVLSGRSPRVHTVPTRMVRTVRMVTKVVTATRAAGNIRGSKRNMPGDLFRRAPQGWSPRLSYVAFRPSREGLPMEEIKIADSRALDVVAREPDPKLSENALRVLAKRYLKKNDKGKVIETPKELFARVAWNLAQAERNYGATEAQVEETARRFFRIISNLEFLPNSPTLMNAGLDLQQLSACFVLPVDDSLAGIFHTLQEAALIHQSGGGTGFSFSRLRPKNDFVRSTMGVASGPVSFMKVYDAATQQVKQGSKRRGANMGILRVDHPDILDFITCKDRTSEITNFNISVAVTDTFW